LGGQNLGAAVFEGDKGGRGRVFASVALFDLDLFLQRLHPVQAVLHRVHLDRALGVEAVLGAAPRARERAAHRGRLALHLHPAPLLGDVVVQQVFRHKLELGVLGEQGVDGGGVVDGLRRTKQQ
jgi:hypothetical protein